MLKIKKQIKNPDGTVTEIEGTEAEVEAFLRKQEKKRESFEKRKDLILGKGISRQELQKMIQDEVAKRVPQQVHHYWYQTNGWWWRPCWDGVRFTWQYTNQDPYLHPSQTWCTFNSSNELSSHLGFSDGYVESKVWNTPCLGIATNGLVDAGTYTAGGTDVFGQLKVGDLKVDQGVGSLLTAYAEYSAKSNLADAVNGTDKALTWTAKN